MAHTMRQQADLPARVRPPDWMAEDGDRFAHLYESVRLPTDAADRQSCEDSVPLGAFCFLAAAGIGVCGVVVAVVRWVLA